MIVRQRFSLSQRLLVGLLIVSFAYWAVIAWLTIRDSINETYEIFDAHLAQTALALLRVTDPDDGDHHEIPTGGAPPLLEEISSQWLHLPERIVGVGPASGTPDGRNIAAAPVATGSAKVGSIRSLHREYGQKLRYQVWDGEGHLLSRSINAPTAVMSAQDKFSESVDKDGQVWRYFGVWDRHHHFRVLVAESHDVRNQLIRSISLHLVSPLVLGLPVLFLLLWLSINRGLRPLGALAREIGKRKSDNLTLLNADSAPEEARPMVLALNDLLLRMTHTLENERLFTANAAHELRTPLAAIQAHLHTAYTADGKTERLRVLDQVQRSVERGIRLVSQLLALARLDPEQALPDVRPVSLGEMAEAVCADMAPLALQRDQNLELQVESDLPTLPGNADMLSMLLGNLLDNAIRYTPRGGHIGVDVRRSTAGFLMEVSDDGPGIPAAQRQQVFDRFYRIAGQDQPGTGLGLAICQRIAELHNARINLTEGPGGRGLAARVSFKGL